jgi:pimeloyl-ACP methyl ester carboxylesterase
VRTGRIRVGTIGTPVLEAGPRSVDRAVLFVHGNPGSRLDWEDLVSRAGVAGLRAVAFDLPGFSEADKPEDFPATVSDYADFIDAVRCELGIAHVDLVVHDFGGAFGMTWAARHPAAFESIVIVNAPPMAGYRWYLLAHVWRTPLAGELLHRTLVKPTFVLLARRGHPRGLPRPFLERMWSQYDAGTRRTVLKLYRATDARRMSPESPATLRRLGRPALVVWGPHDAYIPTRFAFKHREAFPDAAFVRLPESGHFPMADDPSGLAAAVLPFLERVASA